MLNMLPTQRCTQIEKLFCKARSKDKEHTWFLASSGLPPIALSTEPLCSRSAGGDLQPAVCRGERWEREAGSGRPGLFRQKPAGGAPDWAAAQDQQPGTTAAAAAAAADPPPPRLPGARSPVPEAASACALARLPDRPFSCAPRRRSPR
ncbi:Hypothetical predicted protein [Podarcis lilfordi]|uniref:Uncharacterized protein n=1 Tax=Podarcis lilfordi TaxID=74358 RepID=A0AA35LC21_9SAUR|nr:Hypothetical predicted protein [Podarcis lilfordi]